MTPAVLDSFQSENQRTGYAICLDEQKEQPQFQVPQSDCYEPRISIPTYILTSAQLDTYFLSLEEQRAFDYALRQSVRVVHKATRRTQD